MNTKAIDMTGMKFGDLTALNPEGVSGARNIIWRLVCVCGEERVADGYSVRTGKVKSCKSCSRERLGIATIKHGKTNTPEFCIWTDLHSRCYNSKVKSYANYGGRGIKMCATWKDSFEVFLKDMGERPSEKHSIDRINNDGDYAPGNCRWATAKEQANNKRNNIVIEIHGEKKSAKEWAIESGLSYATILQRYHQGRRGLELLKPSQRCGSIEYNGITDTLAGWSKRTGIKESTIAMRISTYGWSIERSLTYMNGERN